MPWRQHRGGTWADGGAAADITKPGAKIIDLHFSEPVVPRDPVDTSAFRLSFGTVYGSGPQAMSRYEGPRSLLCGTSDYCIDEAEITTVEPGSNEATLRLTISTWTPYICDTLNYFGQVGTAKLLLHYRGEASCIEDTDGEPLAPFGQTWVDYDADYYMLVEGDLPEKPLPIPCKG